MKKIIIIITTMLSLSSCQRLILENDPEIIYKVNASEHDEDWDVQDFKYIVRTHKITMATNKNYKIGDTLTIK